MAAHLRPRVQPTTNREGRNGPSSQKPTAGKCSGLLGGSRVGSKQMTRQLCFRFAQG